MGLLHFLAHPREGCIQSSVLPKRVDLGVMLCTRSKWWRWKTKHELSTDTKISSGMLENVLRCPLLGQQCRIRAVVGYAEKSGGCCGLCIAKEEEMNLELTCSSGEGERRGGGGWEALQGAGAQSLGSVCVGKYLFVRLNEVWAMAVDSSLR